MRILQGEPSRYADKIMEDKEFILYSLDFDMMRVFDAFNVSIHFSG